jgi:chromosomal replication initiation ATPase DnaA
MKKEITKAAKLAGYGYPAIIADFRFADLSRVRFAIMLAMRDERHLTYPQIARHLNRDHSTIMHGVRRARELLADAEFQALYNQIREIFIVKVSPQKAAD